MHFHLSTQFPNSFADPFFKTSEQTWDYNCIAWAYGINDKWLWPIKSSMLPNAYWPPTVPAIVHTDSFIKLFEEIGYVICDNGVLEEGFEKVALFEKSNIPTNAAKQLANGVWSSKLGAYFDASHSLNCASAGEYGDVSVFMKRQIQ